jgi:hypothetical protein
MTHHIQDTVVTEEVGHLEKNVSKQQNNGPSGDHHTVLHDAEAMPSVFKVVESDIQSKEYFQRLVRPSEGFILDVLFFVCAKIIGLRFCFAE